MEANARRRLDCLFRQFVPELENICGIQLEPTVNDFAHAVLIGGMALDIHATPSSVPSPKTTTPGKVHYMLGGVARNVAECMFQLGSKPFMISAVGTDMAGELLLQHWSSTGLSDKGIRKQKNISTPVMCIIFDNHGEVAAAVASVEAIERFVDAHWIHHCEHKIRGAPILMVDANLSPAALQACCEVADKFDVPVWFEPVSVAKSRRISSVSHLVSIVSPNADELLAMANAFSEGDTPFASIDCDEISLEKLIQMCKRPVTMLLEKGIKLVAVTLGAKGVLLCSRGAKFMNFRLKATKLLRLVSPFPLRPSLASTLAEKEASDLVIAHFPALPAAVVRLTGAGDCFVGGTLVGLCNGLDILQSAAVGVAAAKAAVGDAANVPSRFDMSALANDAHVAYSKVTLIN